MATPMMASTTITTAAQNSGVSGMKIIRMATCSFERLVVTLVRQRLDKRLCELVGGAPVQRLVDHQPEPREVLAGGADQYAPGLQRRLVLRALNLFHVQFDEVGAVRDRLDAETRVLLQPGEQRLRHRHRLLVPLKEAV